MKKLYQPYSVPAMADRRGTPSARCCAYAVRPMRTAVRTPADPSAILIAAGQPAIAEPQPELRFGGGAVVPQVADIVQAIRDLHDQ